MNSYLIAAVIVAVIIIVVLAGYALKLTKQVKVAEAERERRLAEIDERAEEVMDEVALGIGVIARAYLQDDMSPTEASLRIVTIADQLQISGFVEAMHPSVYELARRTQHLPILEAYAKLGRQEQHKVDLERWKHEAELKEALDPSMKSLQDFKRPKFDNAAG